MNFSRVDLPAAGVRSLAWDGDTLVDWVAGGRYPLAGPAEQLNVGHGYRFDAAVGLGAWGVAFEARGTKGRVLRDNGQRQDGGIVPMSVDVVREIDRSYYHADDFLFPITLFRSAGGRPLLAHCPRGYNVLDLEDLVHGTCLTPRPKEGATDVFHSRLEASPDGRWLLSNGWVWHPWRVASVYDVARAIEQPAYLSTDGEKLDLGDAWEGEVEAATFVGNRLVCATSEEPCALALYDLHARRHEGLVVLSEAAGTRLMALDDDHIVLFDGHPRVLRLSTGAIIQCWEDLDGGSGVPAPGDDLTDATPCLATDPARGRFALGWPERIVVVSRAG
jgi:hypothetical protein